MVKLYNDKGIDSTYGVMGNVDSWNMNEELITSGGAGQINTTIKVKVLEDIGILKNTGGW